MQLPSVLAVLAALALSQTATAAPAAAAGPLATRADPHELDFRTFGVAGCSAQNQGVYTLLQSDANKCRKFVEPIGSLRVTDNLCTLRVYDNDACTGSHKVVPTSACENGSWKSYKMTC